MTRAEIDAASARHAESETLYDQPYEDGKRVRVAGRSRSSRKCATPRKVSQGPACAC
jgi:hypothetical protein